MQNRVGATLARVGRLFLIASFAGVTWLVAAASVSAQRATGAERPDDRNTSRVLGNMELTAADNVVKRVVDRLDFESYKALIKGLTEFGDREQGTPRNAAAIDWIEAQLQSWATRPSASTTSSRPAVGPSRSPGKRSTRPRSEARFRARCTFSVVIWTDAGAVKPRTMTRRGPPS